MGKLPKYAGDLRRTCLMLFLLAVPTAVMAQYNYTTNNGTITITGYTGPGGSVIIPTNINGLTVTSIGTGAFQFPFGITTGIINITSVTIPNSITDIGDRAFASCFNGVFYFSEPAQTNGGGRYYRVRSP